MENVVFSSAIVALCLHYRFFFLSLCSSLKYVYWGFTFFSVASVTSDIFLQIKEMDEDL